MRTAFSAALVVCTVLGVFAPARAAFTPYNPPPSGEDSRVQILNNIYGATFTASGLDFTSNHGVNAIRVQDIFDTGTLLPDPHTLAQSEAVGNDDQVWTANFRLASAEAKFASYGQEFGYFDGTSSTTYHKLFNETGSGYAVDEVGTTDLSFLSNHTLRWARGGQSRVFSSRNSDNSDGLDHMITYRIEGLDDGKLTWLLFWEDLLPGEGPDYDYNDMVIQITAVPTVQGLIPEPATLGLLMPALLLVGRRQARRPLVM